MKTTQKCVFFLYVIHISEEDIPIDNNEAWSIGEIVVKGKKKTPVLSSSVERKEKKMGRKKLRKRDFVLYEADLSGDDSGDEEEDEVTGDERDAGFIVDDQTPEKNDSFDQHAAYLQSLQYVNLNRKNSRYFLI